MLDDFLTVDVVNELIGPEIVGNILMYPSLISGLPIMIGLEGVGQGGVWGGSQVFGLCDVGSGWPRQV